MNEWLISLGIEHWKPVLATVLLPPVPLLLLVLLGTALRVRRPALGWLSVLAGLTGLWLICTTALGSALQQALTQPPPPLTAAQRSGLRNAPHTAILVLGAGRRAEAPEYGEADLKPMTWERLRYGLWLARQTGLPLGYSGGLGHGAAPGPSEAEAVRQVAARDFGVQLRWLEDRSRDTHENAVYSVRLLRAAGIQHIVLVTHGFHQRRALAAFARAIDREGAGISLLPAPMDVARVGGLRPSDWLPTTTGFEMTWVAVHEWLGRIAGA